MIKLDNTWTKELKKDNPNIVMAVTDGKDVVGSIHKVEFENGNVEFGFEFVDDQKLTPKEKDYTHRSMQSVFNHMKKLEKKMVSESQEYVVKYKTKHNETFSSGVMDKKKAEEKYFTWTNKIERGRNKEMVNVMLYKKLPGGKLEMIEALYEETTLKESFKNPVDLAKSLPKLRAINQDTVVIPDTNTMFDLKKVLQKKGYVYDNRTSVWKKGKSSIGINWDGDWGRGSAVMWEQNMLGENILNEKVDIKKLKGPFPFIAKSGKKIDLYNDPKRNKEQWYIPQLDKFVDEDEAQKFLKSESLGNSILNTLEEDFKADYRKYKETGDEKILEKARSQFKKIEKNMSPGARGEWTVKLFDSIKEGFIVSVKNKDKKYEYDTAPFLSKSEAQDYADYVKKMDSNVISAKVIKEELKAEKGQWYKVKYTVLSDKSTGTAMYRSEKDAQHYFKLMKKDPDVDPKSVKLVVEYLNNTMSMLEEGKKLKDFSDEELEKVIKEFPHSIYAMEAKQLLRFRKKGIKESTMAENYKKNVNSIKAHDNMKTDDKGFLEWEQAEDIEDLFNLMKSHGIRAKAPTTFMGLAVPPNVQTILNQKFSGKGSLSDIKTVKAPTSTKMKEEVELDEALEMKQNGGKIDILDQHQMIDDLFNLSKGMGRTKPLKTYKGIQLEGKFSDVLLEVQNKLDEHYEAEKQARLDEQKKNISGSYLDQISKDMARVNGTPLKKKVIEEGLARSKSFQPRLKHLPVKIGDYRKFAHGDEVVYKSVKLDSRNQYAEIRKITIEEWDENQVIVYAYYNSDEYGFDEFELDQVEVDLVDLDTDTRLKKWLKTLDKYKGTRGAGKAKIIS